MPEKETGKKRKQEDPTSEYSDDDEADEDDASTEDGEDASPDQGDWCMGPELRAHGIPVIAVRGDRNDLTHSLLLGLPRHKFDSDKKQLDLREDLQNYARDNEIFAKVTKADEFWIGEKKDWDKQVNGIFEKDVNTYAKKSVCSNLEPATVLPVFALMMKMRVILYSRNTWEGWLTTEYDGREHVEGGLVITRHRGKKVYRTEWQETIGLVLYQRHFDFFDYDAWRRQSRDDL
jgi:hypothetical protein